MIFDCVYSIDQEPNKLKKKRMLKALSDKEFEVIKHCYFNKEVRVLKEFARDFLSNGYNARDAAPVSFIGIITYAAGPFDDSILLTMIFDYLNAVAQSYGDRAGRRASRVLFGEQRCIGITTADVVQEEKRRNKNGK